MSNEESMQLKKTRKPRTPKPPAPIEYGIPETVRVTNLNLTPNGEQTAITVEGETSTTAADGTVKKVPTTIVFFAPVGADTPRLGAVGRLSFVTAEGDAQR